jgi:hypothetical protein
MHTKNYALADLNGYSLEETVRFSDGPSILQTREFEALSQTIYCETVTWHPEALRLQCKMRRICLQF